MIKMKSKRGITLVSLVMTIIVVSILLTVTIYSVKSSNGSSEYNKMLADIGLLEDKILVYYNKNGELPVTATTENVEGITYYEIDLEKLQNVSLNFGTSTTDANDRYFVNNSLEVYYKKGTHQGEQTYHTND